MDGIINYVAKKMYKDTQPERHGDAERERGRDGMVENREKQIE